MNPLSTIIVDDENLARRGLSLRLAEIPEVKIVAECANGQQALAAIAEHSPDLVFLDIQMPGMDGFAVVEEMQSDDMPMVVFVTAFDQYAVDAFRIHAVDYVLKPIEDERLHEAVARALEQRAQQDSVREKEKLLKLVMGLNGENPGSIEEPGTSGGKQWPEKLTIKDGCDIQFIKVADIQWVDAAGDYMCVHAGGDTHIMRITMKQLEAQLNPEQFLRVHRSTIVNANGIVRAQTLNNGEYLLTLEAGTQIKVSRSYRDKVKHLIDG
ncbi:response regulator transcription factor [Parahaliea maris]|uniref:Response regulator transcription factor n=1 Tax=Parahaliea maris TaxID=2716870 RepID=A0A5C9A1G1_9GAMM|nr:LytTR family DNA-binding domain-containing protein [Parahaliea maris]TXS93834.1 response regulator transcription factor [Parahaliea maris]